MPTRSRSLKSSHELGKHESSPIRITFNKIRIEENELGEELDSLPVAVLPLCSHHQMMLHHQQLRDIRQTHSLDRTLLPHNSTS
jgi:hypothetical protein